MKALTAIGCTDVRVIGMPFDYGARFGVACEFYVGSKRVRCAIRGTEETPKLWDELEVAALHIAKENMGKMK